MSASSSNSNSAETDFNDTVDEQQILQTFQAMKNELNALANRISEFETDLNDHQ